MTGMSDAVRVETSGRVTTVILDRPDVRNAVDPETGRKLVDAFLAFEHDDEADVAVFWGAHGAFCAGGDLKHLAASGADVWLNKLSFPRGEQGETPPGPRRYSGNARPPRRTRRRPSAHRVPCLEDARASWPGDHGRSR